MSADMVIHIEQGLAEEDLQCFFKSTLGSKYFGGLLGSSYVCAEKDILCSHWERVSNTPSVGVGEVSWLKAALLESDVYIPGPIEQINTLLDDHPVLTAELVQQISDAFKSPNDSIYQLDSEGVRERVVEFVEQYLGQRAFTISW